MSTISGNRYTISAGNEHWLVDEDHLLAVTHPIEMAPLPLCDAGIRGVLSTQCGTLALLAMPNAADLATTLAALVQTDKGPVALAVDHVAKGDLTTATEEGGVLATRLQSLMVCFSQTTDSGFEAGNMASNSVRERFLLVDEGPDCRLAVRASRISRIERCQNLLPVLGVKGGHQVVQAGGQLIQAQQLSQRLGRDGTSAVASWCLQMNDGAQSMAILVSGIGGLIEVDAGDVCTVPVAGQPTHWLLRPDHEPLEIVLEDKSRSVPVTVQPGTSKGAGWQAESAKAVCLAMRVQVGPYALVIGQELLGPVMGTLPAASPRRSSRHDVRIWHLDRLLGLEASTQPTHALTLRLAGHCVVLLCDRIEPVTSLAGFSPTPCLPKHLADLLQGIRIVHGTAELMLSAQASRVALRALLRQRLRSARAGWNHVVWNHKEEIRTDHAQ